MKNMKDDPTSIGSILLAMGVITEEQLDRVIEEQQRLREDTLLGKLLVANGYCTAQQLEIAIAAQEGMRSEDKASNAIALADVALSRHRRPSVIKQRKRIMEKGQEAVKSITRDDYPAVAAAGNSDSGLLKVR
jgi:hypothetical protein